VTSDPDLEAKGRFFRGWFQMSSQLGGRGVSSGGGWRVSAQLALVGGERERGDMAPQPWSPA
jgi:hypothetical protein